MTVSYRQPSIKSRKNDQADLDVVFLIARKNVSFNFLDSLLQTLRGIADDPKAVKGTNLLTECLAVYANQQLVQDLKRSYWIFNSL